MNNFFEQESNDNEIDLISLFKTISREKNIVLITAFIATTVSIVHSLLVEPIYIGGFKILTKEENQMSRTNSLVDKNNLSKFIGNGNQTQTIILQSPSVLMPVFKEVKNYYKEIKKPKKNMTFNSWRKKHVNINFEKGSKVLNIQYKHQDKNHILDTLNSISREYQDYSKSKTLLKLERTSKYLKEQKSTLENNFLNSQKELNQHSIKHGLGNLDGFLSLSVENISKKDSEKLKINSQNTNQNSYNTWQRYSRQFGLLEEYESQYMDLSSKLNDNSNTKRLLKEKIENLRLALKRPNEILLEHRELTRRAMRDETLLKNIDYELEITNLEKIKNPYPWQLISTPTLEKQRIYPKRSQQVIVSFLISSFFGGVLAIIKEKTSRIVHDLNYIKKNISAQFLDTIYSSDLDLCVQEVKNLFQNETISNKNKFGIISLKPNYLKLLENKFKKQDNIFMLDFKQQQLIEGYDQILLILELGQFTKNDLIYFNKYTKPYQNKIILKRLN